MAPGFCCLLPSCILVLQDIVWPVPPFPPRSVTPCGRKGDTPEVPLIIHTSMCGGVSNLTSSSLLYGCWMSWLYQRPCSVVFVGAGLRRMADAYRGCAQHAGTLGSRYELQLSSCAFGCFVKTPIVDAGVNTAVCGVCWVWLCGGVFRCDPGRSGCRGDCLGDCLG